MSIKLTEILLEAGVNLNQNDGLFQTPLYYAAKEGKTRLIEFLVKAGYNINHIDTYG